MEEEEEVIVRYWLLKHYNIPGWTIIMGEKENKLHKGIVENVFHIPRPLAHKSNCSAACEDRCFLSVVFKKKKKNTFLIVKIAAMDTITTIYIWGPGCSSVTMIL